MARGRAERAAAIRWADLRQRTVSAAVLAPVCLGCIWLGAWPWQAMLALGIAVLAAEWAALCGMPVRALPGLAVPVMVLAVCAVAATNRASAALLLLAALCAGFAAAARQYRRLAWGALYVGVPGIAMVWLRGADAAGRADVLFLMLVVWASDIGAYLAGRLIGGARLAPAISPGKTISGAAGGLAAAGLVGVLAARWHGAGATLAHVALLALILGVTAQAGDLLESLIKRRFGVKDSGRLIPGHGGLLDRVDGLLAAAPAAALLALVWGRGVLLWQ